MLETYVNRSMSALSVSDTVSKYTINVTHIYIIDCGWLCINVNVSGRSSYWFCSGGYRKVNCILFSNGSAVTDVYALKVVLLRRLLTELSLDIHIHVYGIDIHLICLFLLFCLHACTVKHDGIICNRSAVFVSLPFHRSIECYCCYFV